VEINQFGWSSNPYWH